MPLITIVDFVAGALDVTATRSVCPLTRSPGAVVVSLPAVTAALPATTKCMRTGCQQVHADGVAGRGRGGRVEVVSTNVSVPKSRFAPTGTALDRFDVTRGW